MHNVVNKVLFITAIVLIALFAYKTIKTPSAISTTVSINSEEQRSLAETNQVERTEKIVQEYLLNNPEIIIQAIESFQQRKMQEVELQTSQYIMDNKAIIEDSIMSPVLGNPDGDVVIVAFYDYNCSYCKKGDNFIEQLIKSDNAVKIILKVFPILDESSNYAASVALAVYKISPNQFKNIHNGLMNLRTITKDSVTKLLLAENISPEIIATEINKEEIKNLISSNKQLGKNLKIQGVPVYIINGRLISGMIDLAQLQKIIATTRNQNKK